MPPCATTLVAHASIGCVAHASVACVAHASLACVARTSIASVAHALNRELFRTGLQLPRARALSVVKTMFVSAKQQHCMWEQVIPPMQMLTHPANRSGQMLWQMVNPC